MNSITIVVASYNYGMFAAQAIDSVLSQTRRADDVIFLDDCSDEGDIGCDVARKYRTRTIRRERNMGIIDNYNDVLFNHINTEKVMFLAADDYINPLYLEKMDLGVDIISCDITLVGSEASKIPLGKRQEYKDGYWIWRFSQENKNINRANFIHGSSIYNVKLARELGGYESRKGRVRVRLEEDWMLFKKMINAGGIHVHIPMPLLFYRKWRWNNNGVY